MANEYKVSEDEIRRRKMAFLSLSIFLIIGLFLSAKILKVQVFIWIYVIFCLVLVILNLWINLFFNKFLMMKICLSKKVLKRISNEKSEKFLIENIKKIKIKKTITKNIREIYIYLRDGKNIFINGLDNFEKFTNELLKMINKDVLMKTIYEPINFDSIFFYPILGLILSFFTIYLFKIIYIVSFQTIKIILIVSLIYIFLVSLFFIIKKPILKRYGK